MRAWNGSGRIPVQVTGDEALLLLTMWTRKTATTLKEERASSP